MDLASFAPSREPCSTSSKKKPPCKFDSAGGLGNEWLFYIKVV